MGRPAASSPGGHFQLWLPDRAPKVWYGGIAMRLLRGFVILALVTTLGASPAWADRALVTTDPRHLVFGAVEVGETSQPQTVTWTNRTSETISIFNWVLYTGENFDYHNFPGSSCSALPQGEFGVLLQPGASCSFEVVFHPSMQGRITGQIVMSFFITDPSQPSEVVLRISGIGT
jgi:hypothetical protein